MGELTDLIITLLSKAGRWFNVKGQRICFVIWFFCLIYWTARNLSMSLYVQSIGCLFSMGFHLYGYFNWKNKGIGK